MIKYRQYWTDDDIPWGIFLLILVPLIGLLSVIAMDSLPAAVRIILLVVAMINVSFYLSMEYRFNYKQYGLRFCFPSCTNTLNVHHTASLAVAAVTASIW